MNALIFAAALLLAPPALDPTTPTNPPNPPAPLRSRTFLLTCRAVVPSPPAGTRTLDVWLPLPHPDRNQDVTVLQTDCPGPCNVTTDTYGNQMLHLRRQVVQGQYVYQLESGSSRQVLRTITAPVGPLTVTMQARITRREHRNLRASDDQAPAETEVSDPQQARWLAPDRLVPLDARITAQAQAVATAAHATTPLAQARAIYEHVVGTMAYDKTGQGWGQGDIYYACDARRGNCTDFHAVVIGYCRALGIPARFSIGLPLPAGRGQGEIKGYHCWAECFTAATGWVPIDASEAAKDPSRRAYFFGAHDENRVEFTRGRDLDLVPRQAGPPLNFFVYPYAEADGKVLEGVERRYTFEDVP